MRIEKALLTPNHFSRPGRRLERVAGLVAHYTACPRAGARAVRNYFESLLNQDIFGAVIYASVHFVVGLSGEIVQCLPTDEMAYHVGAKTYRPEAVERLGTYPNNCTIGVELCHRAPSGAFDPETWDAAVELFAQLSRGFGLDPKTDIWTHHSVTGKLCPKWFVEHPADLDRFRAEVALALDAEGENHGTQR